MHQFKTMWKLMGSARVPVLLGSALRLLQSLCLGVAFGAAMSLVIHIAHGESPTSEQVWWIAGMCMGSVVAQLCFGWAAARLSWLSAYQAVANMRLKLLAHLREIPVNALGSRSRGDIAALLSTDTQLVEDFLSDGLPRLGQALGIPLIVLVAVAMQDAWLAVAIGLPILLVIPVMSWSSKRLRTLGDRRGETQVNAAARMLDLVSAMPALRVYSTRGRTQAWYDKAVDEFRSLSVEMVHRLIVPSTAAGLVLLLGIPVVVLTSGYRLTQDSTEVALVAVVLVVVLNVYQPVQGLLATNESWQMAQASLRRMSAVLDIPPLPVTDNPRSISDVRNSVSVELDRVSYSYPDGSVGVREINLVAPAGKTTAVVGASGSGKSTVLNLIARFDDPSSGSVFVDGIELRDLSPAERADLVTVVFQDVHLFPGTIADNIAVGRPNASRQQIEDAAKLACADEFIRQLPQGYDTVLGEDGAGLSGGQRQRLSIARAALKDAPVVLLDEATSALDPVNEAAVQRGLEALRAGRTTIVVAHRLGTIASADQICVLDDGYVAEVGTHEELVAANGVYARLWSILGRSSDWTL